MTETELHQRLAPLYAECIHDQRQLEAECHAILQWFIHPHFERGVNVGFEMACKRHCKYCRDPNEPMATYDGTKWVHGERPCVASDIRGLVIARTCAR